ncbi:MAG: glutamate-1-semialdehyde 2,1-aminomutase, partial [Armatimonadota bacterium]
MNISEPREFTNSQRIYAEACKVIPGGVNSPVRAFRSVGGEPIVISSGSGCHVRDADGNTYIDYVGSWGPLILGHAHPVVVDAICKTAVMGTTFGALTAREVQFARLMCSALPSVEMVRLVSSGTEAVMSAIRVARAATGRDLIIKFEGGYHGHSDGLLSKAGSGVATLGISGSPGVPQAFAEQTLTIPFNDIDALSQTLAAYPGRIACLIGEPVPANMGVVPPNAGYWQTVRQMLDDHKVLLIFDEVITGFRLGWNGGQGFVGIKPDLCTLGKIIGGGLPVGAYGGRADLMRLVAPEGPVYQAGTLSGNPLAVAAGLATLRTLQDDNPYEHLGNLTGMLVAGLLDGAAAAGVPVTINQSGSLFTMFFTDSPVTDYTSAARSNTERYAAFFWASLRAGIMLAPSQFEAAFVSTA